MLIFIYLFINEPYLHFIKLRPKLSTLLKREINGYSPFFLLKSNKDSNLSGILYFNKASYFSQLDFELNFPASIFSAKTEHNKHQKLY